MKKDIQHIIDKFEIFENREFQDIDLHSKILNSIRKIKAPSKEGATLIRVNNHNKDKFSFTFAFQTYLIRDGNLYKDRSNFKLSKQDIEELFIKLEIASSFKNETGNTEPAYLNVYKPSSGESFWKFAINIVLRKVEDNKKVKAHLLNLINMFDNFDKEYAKDVSEEDMKVINNLIKMERFGILELKTFEMFDFEEHNNDTVEMWLESNNFYEDNGKWSTNSMFTITVPDYLIDNKGYLKVKFGKISGDFEISDMSLVSLKGCPDEVEGTFECINTRISDLKHLPLKINNLYLVKNNLKDISTMEDSQINGYINISDNKLTSLEGVPYIINGGFSCKNNDLTSLEGGPSEVKGTFNCSNNNITTLYGAPRLIRGKTIIDNLPMVPETEIKFFLAEKEYTNYYNDLLNWIISTQTENELDEINWPEDFLKKNKNILSNIKRINKYGLGLNIENDLN